MIEASAPAKVILFGEHGVVYGQPAIAVPVSSLRATATVEPNQPSVRGLRIAAADLNEMLPVEVGSDAMQNALVLMARLVLEALHVQPPDVTITVQSQIPLASGLGSGAAVSAALARALSQALGCPLDNARLNALVYEVEKIHHGTPSGVDNTVVVYEQPVYFVREHPMETISIGRPFSLLIGDTGHGALTRVAVGAVRELYNADQARIQPILDAVGSCVSAARQAIEQGNVSSLGPLMNQNHALLQDLTVSSLELDALVNAARDAGALGAKLSGGGRGGNMIALVTPETAPPVEAALRAAGAVRVISTTVGG
jgi:mevalonate kinase